MSNFQVNPFWDYSLSIYGKPGVADACVFLQDRYGLDVNIMLFCIWFASSGRGPLDGKDIDDCVRRTGDWRGQVIEPLRSIRRACRDQPLGVPEFLLQIFRPLMRDIELHAEHVEQLVLAETVRDRPAEDVAGDVRVNDAEQSLFAYVRGAGLERDASIDECIGKILLAAFPA